MGPRAPGKTFLLEAFGQRAKSAATLGAEFLYEPESGSGNSDAASPRPEALVRLPEDRTTAAPPRPANLGLRHTRHVKLYRCAEWMPKRGVLGCCEFSLRSSQRLRGLRPRRPLKAVARCKSHRDLRRPQWEVVHHSERKALHVTAAPS